MVQIVTTFLALKIALYFLHPHMQFLRQSEIVMGPGQTWDNRVLKQVV